MPRTPIEVAQGKVLMFKCCCEGRLVNFTYGKQKGYINQDEKFIGEGKRRHPFLIITPTNKIKEGQYLTAIPLTSQGDTEYNQENSIQVIGDMIKKDNAQIIKKSFLKIDMPTRILLDYLDKDSYDCDQATFQMGKSFNNILIQVAEKHFSNS
jgi:hypothetical protein